MSGSVCTRNPSWPKCVWGSAQPSKVPSWHRGCSVCPVLSPGQGHEGTGTQIWLLAPSPPPTALPAPQTPNPKPGSLSWLRLSLCDQPHTCVGLGILGSRSRALSPSPWQPQAEAQNSPEDSHSSAEQKTQRQGTCRSGRSCSMCRVCLSSQGPETEADEESEAGFTWISLTRAGSTLTQQ